MITNKEAYAIEAIISNEYSGNNNYLPPYDTPYEEANTGSCWADTLNYSGAEHGEKTTGKQLSGVIASLNKKGFAESWGEGKEAVIEVTKEGWAAYQEYMKNLKEEEDKRRQEDE